MMLKVEKGLKEKGLKVEKVGVALFCVYCTWLHVVVVVAW